MEIINKELSSEELIEKRKEKFLILLKNKQLWVVAVLIIAIILGIYIRYQPLADHNGKPGLWDITTNDYTLGPDLDPWLFTRYAKEMIAGTFSNKDIMRYSPIGFDTTTELQMVSYFIVLTNYMVNIFGNYSVNFSAAFMPVWIFGLTIIFFFLFVREIFVKKSSENKNLKANLIALISTFFMIVTPVFLSRTIAGIPEKESVGFMFMFLAFYLFLKSWKEEKLWTSAILGVLAGISTALMGLSWGGVTYIYFAISTSAFIAFILNKFHKKEVLAFSLWIASSLIVTLLFTNRFSIKDFITGLDTGLAFFVLFIILINYLLWNTKFKIKALENIKLPKNIISLIVAIILAIIAISIIMGPSLIINKVVGVNKMLFEPVTGRWSTTVAENRQPYFTEWAGSFGPFVRNIPLMFWMFFIGSVVLFKSILKVINKKDSWTLTGLYLFFFLGLVFSRYSSNSLFNGENVISRGFYYVSIIALAGGIIYYYIKYYKNSHDGFEKIDFSYIFIFVLLILCLFTARSAVRLIMVLGPIAPIFASYLIVKSIDLYRTNKEDTFRLIVGIFAIILIISSIFTFYSYYNDIKAQAYSFVPSYYNNQWQKAMDWVRTNTSESAVFAHWWDYGYWLQSIGNRATVTDGGNAIVWWNYLMGRLVLTGDNQKDSLNFLHTHNATYLLIDSTDIGKYSAFSSIGSNGKEDSCSPTSECDRFSWIPIMTSDSKQIQETANGTIRVYQGATGIDEDILYNLNGKDIFLPAQKAAILGVTIESKQISNGNTTSLEFQQPNAVFYYNNERFTIPIRYLSFEDKFLDYKTGLNATIKIIPSAAQTSSGGLQMDSLGAGIYISPRVLRGYLGQKYLLDDPFNNFPNFKLAHKEPNLFVDSINNQGYNAGDFIFYGDVQGPIKIWKIEYTGNETINPDYLVTTVPSYITWKF